MTSSIDPVKIEPVEYDVTGNKDTFNYENHRQQRMDYSPELRRPSPPSVSPVPHPSHFYSSPEVQHPAFNFQERGRELSGVQEVPLGENIGAEGARKPLGKTPTGQCKVCGDDASGMYFGALVCVSCKTFFLRYDGNEVNFVCKGSMSCPVTVKSRTQCKYCRYQKCLQAGMYRRVRPAQVQASEGQQLCAVCGDIGNGIHFGAITCEGCKKFFRRGLSEQYSYVCMNNTECVINPRTRNSCRYCRYQKCLQIGMSRDAIQMGRPSKMSHEVLSAAGLRRPEVSNRSRKIQPQESLDTNLNGLSNQSGYLRFGEPRQRDPGHDLQALDLSRSSIGLGPLDGFYERGGSDGRMAERYPENDPQPDSTVSSLPDGSGIDLRALLERGGLPNMHQMVWQELMERIVKDFAANVARQNAEYRASLLGSHTSQLSCTPLTFTTSTFTESCGLNASKLLSTCASMAQNKRKLSDAPQPSSSLTAQTSTMSGGEQLKGESDEYESFKPKKFKASSYASRQNSEGERKLSDSGSTDVDDKQGNTTSSSSSYQPSGHLSRVTSQESRDCSSPSVSSTGVLIDEVEVKKEVSEEPSTSSSLEAQRGVVARKRPDKVEVDVDRLVEESKLYWMNPRLPDTNVLIAERHWDVINKIIPAYDRFVHTGTNLNRTLKNEFEAQVKDTADKQVLTSWIQTKVVPEYTTASVSYCKSLIGFTDFDPDDQVTIIRLGQSPSRILVAALHWFDSDQRRFRNFLSWRDSGLNGRGDLFKEKLINYSEELTQLELDPIEAALLNVLLIIATDYPSLKNVKIIEETRQKILATFTAYAAAKFGSENTRLAVLFSHMPEVRRLGLLHHQMTKTRTMTAEEVEQQLI